MTPRGSAAFVLVLVSALLTGGSSVTAPVARGAAIAVGASGCGRPPDLLPAGRMVFNVSDTTDHDVASVYVIDAGGGEVFGEIRSLPPRVTVPLTATLRAGRYGFRCVFSNGAVETSRTFLVTGATTGAAPGFRPMPDLDLERPVTAYRAWVLAALPGLLAACRTLDADIARGDGVRARADWLTAHLDYERLGAAYNAFGDFDGEIDAMTPAGSAGAGWTGFFAIEQGLWHGAPVAGVRPLSRKLVADVRGLIRDFPSEDIDPGDLPLRAHEILENAQRFQLTGEADHGSGSTLATVYANTQGTGEVLAVLGPLVGAREPGLAASIGTWMGRVRSDLLAARSGGSAGGLSTARRERLDGDLGELLEQLSRVPTLLAPRPSA
jgi:iron uptake system EfeUOB component EfeO/EfeM